MMPSEYWYILSMLYSTSHQKLLCRNKWNSFHPATLSGRWTSLATLRFLKRTACSPVAVHSKLRRSESPNTLSLLDWSPMFWFAFFPLCVYNQLVVRWSYFSRIFHKIVYFLPTCYILLFQTNVFIVVFVVAGDGWGDIVAYVMLVRGLTHHFVLSTQFLLYTI